MQELIPRHIPARSLRSSSQARLRIPNATEKHTHTHTHTKKKKNNNSFLQLCPQVLEYATRNNQGSRFFCDVPQTSKISPVFFYRLFFQCLLDSLCIVTFLCFPKTVSVFLCSFSFEENISFRALIIQVNGTNRYRNEYHHHHHCYGYSQRKKKDDNYITGYTHNWRLVTKKKKKRRRP